MTSAKNNLLAYRSKLQSLFIPGCKKRSNILTNYSLVMRLLEKALDNLQFHPLNSACHSDSSAAYLLSILESI